MARNIATVDVTLNINEFSTAFYAMLAACRIALKKSSWDDRHQADLLYTDSGDVRLSLECAVAMAEAALAKHEIAERNYRHPLLQHIREKADGSMK